jgi:hypothetical protein
MDMLQQQQQQQIFSAVAVNASAGSGGDFKLDVSFFCLSIALCNYVYIRDAQTVKKSKSQSQALNIKPKPFKNAFYSKNLIYNLTYIILAVKNK